MSTEIQHVNQKNLSKRDKAEMYLQKIRDISDDIIPFSQKSWKEVYNQLKHHINQSYKENTFTSTFVTVSNAMNNDKSFKVRILELYKKTNKINNKISFSQEEKNKILFLDSLLQQISCKPFSQREFSKLLIKLAYNELWCSRNYKNSIEFENVFSIQQVNQSSVYSYVFAMERYKINNEIITEGKIHEVAAAIEAVKVTILKRVTEDLKILM